jgi:hypothetical protein
VPASRAYESWVPRAAGRVERHRAVRSVAKDPVPAIYLSVYELREQGRTDIAYGRSRQAVRGEPLADDSYRTQRSRDGLLPPKGIVNPMAAHVEANWCRSTDNLVFVRAGQP